MKEHILEAQDQKEVERIKVNVEECRKTLQSLGYAEFTFEDFFAVLVSSYLIFRVVYIYDHLLIL